jgi:hypothetical protein
MLLGTFLGVMAALYLVSWTRDRARTRAGLRRARARLAADGPNLLAAILGAGLIAQLAAHGPSADTLARLHGPWAIGAAAVLGGASTGGPLVAYPVAGALFRLGDGVPAGVIAAFLTAWTSVSGAGLPLEMAALGRSFAIARNAVALLGACAAGALVAWWLG